MKKIFLFFATISIYSFLNSMENKPLVQHMTKNCFPSLSEEKKKQGSVFCATLGGASGALTAAAGTVGYIAFIEAIKNVPLTAGIWLGVWAGPPAIMVGTALTTVPCIMAANGCLKSSESPNDQNSYIN